MTPVGGGVCENSDFFGMDVNFSMVEGGEALFFIQKRRRRGNFNGNFKVFLGCDTLMVGRGVGVCCS